MFFYCLLNNWRSHILSRVLAVERFKLDFFGIGIVNYFDRGARPGDAGL